MSLIRKILGAKSKYNKEIPYLYEARVPVEMLEGEHHFYLAETVCALIEKLHQDNIPPDRVQIFEINHGKESEIERQFWLSPEGGWLFKPDICRAFQDHYPGHIHDKTCSFDDRNKQGAGPF